MKKRTAGKIRKREWSRVFAAAFLAGIVACLSGCAAPKSGGLSSSKNFQSGEIVSIDTEEMTMTVKLDLGMEFHDDSTAVLDYSCSTGWLQNNRDFEVNPGDNIYFSFFDGKPEEIYCIECIVSEEA